VVLGVATVLLGGWQYPRRRSRLDRGAPFPKPLWHWGVILSTLLALVGVALVVYLVGVGTCRRAAGGMTRARVFCPQRPAVSVS
jgi:hypothetical protein